MSISQNQSVTPQLKQRVFVGALIVLSGILAAVALFWFSPRRTSEITPSQQLHFSSQLRSV